MQQLLILFCSDVFYNEVGPLVPARVDEVNGYRYYDTSQLFRLNEIIALRQMGFSIAEVSAIVGGQDITRTLTMCKAELEREVQNITSQLFRLENYIKERKEGHIMKYQAVVKEIPEYTVYSSTHVLPNYDALYSIMPALGAKVTQLNPGLKCVEPGYCFNVYPDGEYRDKDIHVEICEAVTSRGKDGDGIVFKDIPRATVVSVLHQGSYDQLGNAYAYAMQWVEQNGYEIADNVRESFIDGIWNKENQADWLTEIQVPVRRK